MSGSGVSFMITNEQKSQLRLRGFVDEEIAQLKPGQAHKILNGGGPTFEPDSAAAGRFLKALDPRPDARFTFQTFDDDKIRRKARAEANKLRKKKKKKPL